MGDIFQALIKELDKNKELAKDVVAFWGVGDIVRVPKSNTVNMSAVKHYLGKKCVVENVEIHYGILNKPRVEYFLRLGSSLEPFWEDELDYRFRKRK